MLLLEICVWAAQAFFVFSVFSSVVLADGSFAWIKDVAKQYHTKCFQGEFPQTNTSCQRQCDMCKPAKELSLCVTNYKPLENTSHIKYEKTFWNYSKLFKTPFGRRQYLIHIALRGVESWVTVVATARHTKGTVKRFPDELVHTRKIQDEFYPRINEGFSLFSIALRPLRTSSTRTVNHQTFHKKVVTTLQARVNHLIFILLSVQLGNGRVNIRSSIVQEMLRKVSSFSL